MLNATDFDTSPKMRQMTPEFFGFIPPTGRGLIFVLMTVNSSSQFLAKIVSIALLGAVNKTWTLGYVAGDIGLYLLYTLLRNDFFFYLPIQSYIGSIGASLLLRIISKVINDFANLIQLRDPNVIGGIYWCANMILSQASVALCAYVYLHSEANDEASEANDETSDTKVTKFTSDELVVSLGSLSVAFLLSFATFLLKIERKYLKTFYSTEPGHKKVKRLYLEATTDFARSTLFLNNKYQWLSIRPQVAKWLDDNWDRWEREKPDWFNAVFIESVDDDIMPARVLARLKEEAEGGVRRRSSLMERLSVRVADPGKVDEESDSDSSGREEED